MYLQKITEWLGGFIVRDEPRGGRVWVFLDESGTLSFGTRSSKCFVVACAVTKDVRGVERVARKAFRGFLKKERKKRKGAILHANDETKQTRMRLFKLFAAHKQSRASALIVEKEKVPERLRGEVHFFYNHCVEQLLGAVIEKHKCTDITLIASRRETKKYLKQMFSEHIQRGIQKRHGVVVRVEIIPPFVDRSLQVADFIAWAVFQKHEKGDSQYCDTLGGVDEVFYS